MVRKLLIGAALVAAIILVGAAVLFFGWRPAAIAAPDGVRLTPLRTITTVEAKVLLMLTGVDGVQVTHAADLYRMSYSMTTAQGKVVPLSGLLALPHGAAPRRVVSFQHGTATTRTAVPSAPDGTGVATAIAFAGNGYALVVPDYPGLGESPGRHPYYVAEAIGPAVVAMIEAAERIEGVPRGPVFLSGFSEGGWASLAALRVLESKGREVLGSAQVAGPYDLRHVSLPITMKSQSSVQSLPLAYAAWGWAEYYGHPLDSALTPDVAKAVERVFADGSPEGILAALPAPRQMFNQAVLDAYDQGGSHWYLDLFVTNSLIDITPRAPLRLYYGAKDTVVSPEEALNTARVMRARGANVTAVDVGPVEHDASMLAAAPLILAWLAELERGDIQP